MRKNFALLITFLAAVIMSCAKSEMSEVGGPSTGEQQIPVRVSFVLSDPQTRSMHPAKDTSDKSEIENFESVSMVAVVGTDDKTPLYKYTLIKVQDNSYTAMLPNNIVANDDCRLYFIANADLIDGFNDFETLGELRSATLPKATGTGIDKYVMVTNSIPCLVDGGSLIIKEARLIPTVARLKFRYDNSFTPIDKITIKGTSNNVSLSRFFGSTSYSYSDMEDIEIMGDNLKFDYSDNEKGIGYCYVYPSNKQVTIVVKIKNEERPITINELKTGSSYSIVVRYGLIVGYSTDNNDDVKYNPNESSFELPAGKVLMELTHEDGAQLTSDQHWLRVEEPTAGTKATAIAKKSIICEANFASLERSGTLKISKNGITEVLTISQQGNPIQNWMKYADGSKYISRFSIPGTHNSATATASISLAKCQNYSVTDQLNWGVRALDVRCRHANNAFALYHGSVDLYTTFESLVLECERFLKTYPSEAIIMFVKEEHTSLNITRSFEQTFRELYLTKSYGQLFYLADQLPTLDQVRGKIVLIRRFSISGAYGPLGISTDWQDDVTFTSNRNVKMVVQDKYSIGSYSQISTKWNIANTAFNNSISRSKSEPQTMHINFLSASGFLLTPYSIAEGTGSYRGMNSYMADMINGLDQKDKPCIGIVMMDYLTKDPVASRIIQFN